MPSSLSIEKILQEFESVEAYLQAVHEIVQEGHMPDISDLDDRIGALCANVEGSPSEIQAACLDRLNELLKKLNVCEHEMTALHKAASQK